LVRKSVSIHDKNGASKIRTLLQQEPDVNRALDLVARFLEVYEPWRLKKYGKDLFSISELLELYRCHEILWRANHE
jgi:hypothetical protein